MSKQIFFSTDIESDGPIPGQNSMLSFASVALDENGTVLDTFHRNLKTIEGAVSDPDTMEFWKKNEAAWNAHRKNTVSAETAMKEYVKWVKEVSKTHDGTPVFVAYPAGFDFLFMYWYMIRFANESPFSFSALDIKSYACAILRKPYRNCTKKNMPANWHSNLPHTHEALDDAMEQGMLFINMYKANKPLPPKG